MKRRSGVTLVEVLVAIFVMGIGLIALLTLFPIGMLRMARAIHDERSLQCCLNAHDNSIVFNIRNDPDVVVDAAGVHNAGTPHDVFRNPLPRIGAVNFLLPADDYQESYPIFVDPIGFFAVTGLSQHWVGGVLPTTNAAISTANPPTSHGGALRRRPVQFVSRGAANVAQRNLNILHSFTLWDDMNFEYDLANGPPGGPQRVGTTILRDPRFSWGYTMQRKATGDRSVVDCSVVVFDKRALAITGSGVLAEHVYQNNTYFNPNNNTISIDYTNPAVVPPPVRPGDWIMDVTPYNPMLITNPAAPLPQPAPPAPQTATGAAHAYWYRIVAAEELVIGARRIARYEVQQPIRGWRTFPHELGKPSNRFTQTQGWYDGTLGYLGTSVILEGVAEVFTKGPARP